MTDGQRWRKLVRLVKENAAREHLGAGVVLCVASESRVGDDPPWASLQALDHENPRGVVWIVEGATLAEAIDNAPDGAA